MENSHTEVETSFESEVANEASLVFLGRWQRLVSTTNWEKGRIIREWRVALLEAGASAVECSDEAWSRRVGNVSPQHVGRLRRVAERFFKSRDKFTGLYWSHFQAALDWDDAEMWLEGAVQNRWSISQMREQRRTVLGEAAPAEPHDEVADAGGWDEDSTPSADLSPTLAPVGDIEGESGEYDESEAPFEGDDELGAGDAAATTDGPVRPFERLGELPADLAQAFDAYKLAILHHKLAGWAEISRDDVLASLDALKQLALAPASA